MAKLSAQQQRDVKIELAQRDFWEFCKIMKPQHYKESRAFLKDMCRQMQDFWFQNEKQVLVLNCPPRHFKSLTGQMFTLWVMGLDNSISVMTGSYNESLATLFSKSVRNEIQTPVGQGKRIVYREIFPDTEVDNKDAASNMWRLKGSPVPSYLATSPGGTAVGMGCKLLLVDDLLRNALEALSHNTIETLDNWMFNTMTTRLEGDSWKIIVIMQRWSQEDIAGKFIDSYDCVHVQYPAYHIDDNGEMVFLCPEVLNKKSWMLKTLKMAPYIEQAVYCQKPVDIANRLFRDFNTYRPVEDRIYPAHGEKVFAVCDTADKGTDFLVSYVYIVRENIAYILDRVRSDSPMEITEGLVSAMWDKWGVTDAMVESNNGGRMFARNIRQKVKNKALVINDKFTSGNKEARILNASSWVQNYVWFPENWNRTWSDTYDAIRSYVMKGDNEHDDDVDALTMVYEQVTTDIPAVQVAYAGEMAYNDSILGFSMEPTESDYSQLEYAW